jgi:DNA-binding transcriptional LysR family regulator
MSIRLSNSERMMEWSDRIGRRIKLRDLHILLAVAEFGSMAKAAEQLAISQPVVSRVIADLEHVLGVRLMDRDRHGAELTIYGDALLKRGVAAFDELRSGVAEIDFLSDPTVGELRIGATEVIAAGFVAAVIDRISRRHPRIVFEVRTDGTTELDRELRERNIDLIIGRVPGRIVDEDVATEILFDEPIFIAAGMQNPLSRRRRRMRLGDLVDELWVLPSRENIARSLITEAFHASGLELPRRVIVGNSMQMLNTLLATGRFLAIHPASYLRFSAGLSIKILPVEMPLRSTPVGIVTLKNRTLNPITKLFIEYAHTVARPLAKV